MRFIFLCAAIISSTVLLSATVPDKPTPKKALPVPKIAGPSQWGIIAQSGRKVEIDGHERWFVTDGRIRKDGKLELIWIHRAEGKAAPGVYTINVDGSIIGLWQWGEYVTENADGTLNGLNIPDVLRMKAEFK